MGPKFERGAFDYGRQIKIVTVSFAELPFESVTRIVVPEPPFVLVTLVTRNEPAVVPGATVAIVVSLLVAVKVPE